MRLLPEQIIALQRVIRWHTQGTTRQQSVAEHSAGVAQLALYLAPDSTSAADRADRCPGINSMPKRHWPKRRRL